MVVDFMPVKWGTRRVSSRRESLLVGVVLVRSTFDVGRLARFGRFLVSHSGFAWSRSRPRPRQRHRSPSFAWSAKSPGPVEISWFSGDCGGMSGFPSRAHPGVARWPIEVQSGGSLARRFGVGDD